MLRRITSIIFAVSIIAILAGAVIAYSRGYRIDVDQKTLSTTGILSISSYPEKASILLDGKLVSATNASLSLSPAWYDLKVTLDGYQSWEKKVRVQGEVVTQIDALLIPTNPSLRALTTSGIMAPTLSESSTRVAYAISQDTEVVSAGTPAKTGVWILDLRTGLLGGRTEPKQVFSTRATLDWPNAQLLWSPNEQQLLLTFVNPKDKKKAVSRALLINIESPTLSGTDVTLQLETILAQWKTEAQEKHDLALAVFPREISTILNTVSANIQIAPDDSKILYQATQSATLAPVISPGLIGSNTTSETRSLSAGKYYVYDIREDKNFELAQTTASPNPPTVRWYTDAKHIIMIKNDTINIIDYDGTNERTVYSGPFEKTILFPWPAGGKVVIATNLNNPKSLPNLYEIDLR